MAQSSFRANLGGFDQVNKTACYTSGFRGRFFSLILFKDHGQGYFTQTKTFSIANFVFEIFFQKILVQKEFWASFVFGLFLILFFHKKLRVY